MSQANEIFVIPVQENILIYAPLHNLISLVDKLAATQIRKTLWHRAVAFPSVSTSATVEFIERALKSSSVDPPEARAGPLNNPQFLGLIPTRGCNMGCLYCDFAAPKATSPVMELALVREAIEAYFEIVASTERHHGEIQFFGGEPFYAEEVIHFAVGYARMRAAELGLIIQFEATTNGLYSESRCRWIADYFDRIVLSLDGPADIQNRNRPGIHGQALFSTVARNAKIFSEGNCDLIVRACITRDTTSRMPEIAAWIAQEFCPSSVCFESLTSSPTLTGVGLDPPDPWEFPQAFIAAAQALESYGIETVFSTADIHTRQVTFCPVGRDALIVSPDGTINACYLQKQDWAQKGLDMRLGQVALTNQGNSYTGLVLDTAAVQRVRHLHVNNSPLCADCFCRYHCAGGCHVNHNTNRPAGQYDNLCIQTRLTTLALLLKSLGLRQTLTDWLSDRTALETVAWQPNDRFACWEG